MAYLGSKYGFEIEFAQCGFRCAVDKPGSVDRRGSCHPAVIGTLIQLPIQTAVRRTQVSDDSEKKNDGYGNLVYIFFIPFLLLVLLFSWIGLKMAQGGCKYQSVQIATFPAWFIVANFIGAITIVPLMFIISLLTGERNLFDLTFEYLGDLILWPVWGRILSFFFRMGLTDFSLTTPPIVVFAFQLSLFLLVGHRLARHLPITLIDVVTAIQARSAGINLHSARLARLQNDPGYAKASQYYARTGKPPFLAFSVLIFVGIWPDEFYHFEKA